MIEAVRVTQHYGVRPVLTDVSLRVPGGELACVMGANGVGKSTLLAVLAGVHSPQKGHVLVDGMRRRSTEEVESAIRKRVAYLPASAWLPTSRTGRDFLLAVGRLYGVEDERLFDHVERLARLFHLEEKIDSPIAGYSTGQQKKIALASALVTEAPCLILDEPFAGGLDPSGILALRKVLARLAARPDVTVVMATPVPELVEGLAHRVAVMDEGRLVAYDTPAGLRERTGCDGTLQEVLERLTDPGVLADIDQYFETAS